MSPRLTRILNWVGYPVFYVFCLLIFGYLTFPYDQLKAKIIAEFENQQRASGSSQKLAIDDLGPYWFSGLSASGVRLIIPQSPGPDGERPPSEVQIDRAHVRLSLLPLLIGRVTLSFGAKAFGGTIDGWTRGGDDRSIDVDVDGVEVAQVDAITSAIGVPTTGTLKGHLELVEPDQKLSRANGSMALSVTDFALGDGKAKLQGKLALPKLNIAEVSFSGDVKDGLAKIDKIAASGPDLDLAGDGKVQLRDPFGESLSDVFVRFKFADAYKNKSDITKSLFGSGTGMPALFELADPRIKASKRPDGFYGWHVAGFLKDPRFEPSATGGGSSASKPPPK